MDASAVRAVLGREVRPLPVEGALQSIGRERVLVTGACGSIGAALMELLVVAGVEVYATDVDTLDVRRPMRVGSSPSLIFHLAGAKHAPHGEVDPREVLEVNAIGTQNALDLAAGHGARVVLASTGKAADPETAYGASKLLAERMVLNAGGAVARFFNVVESSGNVFRIWEELPADAALPVAECRRFFISLAEAVSLLVAAAVSPSGRYVFDAGEPRWMADVAEALYPGRPQLRIPPRRGDRVVEPASSACEWVVPVNPDGLLEVVSLHDPARVLEAVAA